jgi:hypothetical protein
MVVRVCHHFSHGKDNWMLSLYMCRISFVFLLCIDNEHDWSSHKKVLCFVSSVFFALSSALLPSSMFCLPTFFSDVCWKVWNVYCCFPKWERLVRSCKCSMYAILGSRCLTECFLTTIVCQVEQILNSRSLTQVSVDPNDLEALFPETLFRCPWRCFFGFCCDWCFVCLGRTLSLWFNNLWVCVLFFVQGVFLNHGQNTGRGFQLNVVFGVRCDLNSSVSYGIFFIISFVCVFSWNDCSRNVTVVLVGCNRWFPSVWRTCLCVW